MSAENRCITVATDDGICELIGSANHRLVVLAPALHTKVANALAARWVALGPHRVSVILDVDAEVFRLGYGEMAALTRLEETATQLGTMIQRQPGIRIGLVIADDVTLIYSPTPLLIEAGPCRSETSRPSTPNAIRLDHTPPRIATEVGHGEDGVRGQTIGLDKAKAANIAKIGADLKANPPQPFDISRKVRVFNAAFEFVDFELSGTSIDQMTIPIPKHLSGIKREQTREQLRTSYRLVPPNHKLSGDHLTKDRNLIAKKYLRLIPKFGNVVLRSRKADFQNEVEQLKKAVEEFGKQVRAKLQDAIDENRADLVKSLLPIVKRTPPKEWYRSDGAKPDAETVRCLLEEDLRLAFGQAESHIKHMQVRVQFKGVTYEMLSDNDFREAAARAIPELKGLYEEFDAAKALSRQLPA